MIATTDGRTDGQGDGLHQTDSLNSTQYITAQHITPQTLYESYRRRGVDYEGSERGMKGGQHRRTSDPPFRPILRPAPPPLAQP